MITRTRLADSGVTGPPAEGGSGLWNTSAWAQGAVQGLMGTCSMSVSSGASGGTVFGACLLPAQMGQVFIKNK